MQRNCNRRNFLGRFIAGCGVLTMPRLATAQSFLQMADRKIRLQKNDVILFTGDSITDGSRVREVYKSPNMPRALGSGYVTLAAAKIHRQRPELNLKLHNTGINGDTIVKLLDRWQTDCLDLKPTVLSILVGVNDFNIAFSKTGSGDARKYEQEYREILQQTKQTLPNVKLIIGEPYAVKGSRQKIDDWYPQFNEYRLVARKIATEFEAAFIPYQGVYEKAAKTAPQHFYSTDGIHPSLAGISLMSEAWCNVIS